MKKQYFSPDQDGFYGAYYPNSTSSKKAMIIMLGESSDDCMVVSAVKWLHKRDCNVMAMSPVQKGAGYYDYPLGWIGHAVQFLKAQGNQKTGIVGASTTGGNRSKAGWRYIGRRHEHRGIGTGTASGFECSSRDQ